MRYAAVVLIGLLNMLGHLTGSATVSRIGFLSAAAACVAMGFLARGWLEPKHPGDTGNISMVGQTGGLKVEKIETYQVTLRDEAGNVVGVQKFNSLEKAQEFAADLARWQSRSEHLASGQFVLHKDRF